MKAWRTSGHSISWQATGASPPHLTGRNSASQRSHLGVDLILKSCSLIFLWSTFTLNEIFSFNHCSLFFFPPLLCRAVPDTIRWCQPSHPITWQGLMRTHWVLSAQRSQRCSAMQLTGLTSPPAFSAHLHTQLTAGPASPAAS